jgi:hypothetical protein
MLTIHPDSHLDHAGITLPHIMWILRTLHTPFLGEGVQVVTLRIPTHLPPLPCGLYGPVMGDAPIGDDEAYYLERSGRSWASRMVAAGPRQSREATAVFGPYDGHENVLFTVYGGPSAPRELDDPSLPATGPRKGPRNCILGRTRSRRHGVAQRGRGVERPCALRGLR